MSKVCFSTPLCVENLLEDVQADMCLKDTLLKYPA